MTNEKLMMIIQVSAILFGCFVLLWFVVDGVRAGRLEMRFITVARKESPAVFWLGIIVFSGAALYLSGWTLLYMFRH